MTPDSIAAHLALLPVLPAMPHGVEIRHVPGWVGYAASSDGKIWSCRRIGPFVRFDPWAEMQCFTTRHGYRKVRLSRNRNPLTLLVHRLILLTFVGECPAGMVGCHNDGNKNNNCIINLRWDTQLQNSADKKRHGSEVHGEGHSAAKLSEQDVASIRREYVKGSSTNGGTGLARKYGVGTTAIYKIIMNKSWSHVRECDQ